MPLRNRTAYGFLAPYLLIFAVFWVWPIINSFMISFQATRTVPWRFAPAFNWGRLISDPAFYNALKNTLIILVIQVPVMITLATVMAVLLNSPLLKAKGLFRFAFFAPVVVGEVAYCRGVPADVQPRFRHRQQAAQRRRHRRASTGSPTPRRPWR